MFELWLKYCLFEMSIRDIDVQVETWTGQFWDLGNTNDVVEKSTWIFFYSSVRYIAVKWNKTSPCLLREWKTKTGSKRELDPRRNEKPGARSQKLRKEELEKRGDIEQWREKASVRGDLKGDKKKYKNPKDVGKNEMGKETTSREGKKEIKIDRSKKYKMARKKERWILRTRSYCKRKRDATSKGWGVEKENEIGRMNKLGGWQGWELGDDSGSRGGCCSR